MKSLKKCTLMLLAIGLMLSCFGLSAVYADEPAVVSITPAYEKTVSIYDDAVITFNGVVETSALETITVEKLETNGTKAAIAYEGSFAEDTFAYTLSFGDNLNYGSAYLITVPAEITGEAVTSMFYTAEAYQSDVVESIIDDGFEERVLGATGVNICKDENGLGLPGVNDFRPQDNTGIKVVQTANAYGVTSKTINTKANTTGYYVRYSNNTLTDVERLGISFRIKPSTDGDWLQLLFKRNSESTGIHMEGNSSSTLPLKVWKDGQTVTLLDKTQLPEYLVFDKWNKFDFEMVKVTHADGSVTAKYAYIAINGKIVPGSVNLDMGTSSYKFWSSTSNNMDIIANWAGETWIDNYKVYTSTEALALPVMNSCDAKDGSVVVKFNKAIDEASLAGITATAGSEDIEITKTLSNDLKTLTISKDGGFEESVANVITISGVKDCAGNEVADYTYKYGQGAPVVTEATPENGSTVMIFENPTITFDTDMDEESLENIVIEKVAPGGTKTSVGYEGTYSNKTYTIDVGGNLEYGTMYQITVPTTVKSEEQIAVNKVFTTAFSTFEEYQAPVKTMLVNDNFNDRETGKSGNDIPKKDLNLVSSKAVTALVSDMYGNETVAVSNSDAGGYYLRATKNISAENRLAVSYKVKLDETSGWMHTYFKAGAADNMMFELQGSGNENLSLRMWNNGSTGGNPTSGNVSIGKAVISEYFNPTDWNKIDSEWVKVIKEDNSVVTKCVYIAINGQIIPGTEDVEFVSDYGLDFTEGGNNIIQVGAGYTTAYIDDYMVYAAHETDKPIVMNAGLYDVSGNIKEGAFVNGETLTFKADILNCTDEDIDVTLYTALYEGSKLVDVALSADKDSKIVSGDLGEKEVSITVPEVLDSEKTYTVKSFIWKKGTLIPVSDFFLTGVPLVTL